MGDLYANAENAKETKTEVLMKGQSIDDHMFKRNK